MQEHCLVLLKIDFKNIILGDTGNQNFDVDQEEMAKTAEERRMRNKASKLMIKV